MIEAIHYITIVKFPSNFGNDNRPPSIHNTKKTMIEAIHYNSQITIQYPETSILLYIYLILKGSGFRL